MPIIIKKIRNEIDTAVIEALKELNYKPKKEKILIKPNIVNPCPPNSPYITSVHAVRGIIQYLKNIGIKDITIGEGPINNNPQLAFDSSGFNEMCRNENVALLDFNKTDYIKVPWYRGEVLIPKIVLESEYINVSKMKTHIQTTVTLGLKNNKGVLRLADKRKFHLNNLHESIANLATIIPVSLSVIDASTAVEGNGPGRTGKTVSDMNLIIAGTNLLATDLLAAQIMGIDIKNVKHLSIAQEMNYFPKLEEEKIIGETIDSVKRKFLLPTSYEKMFNIYYWWDDNTCSGCSGILGDMKKKAQFNPYYLMRLFLFGFLNRLDIITGKMKLPPSNHGKVVCIGTCTKHLAEEYGFIYVAGCPPQPEEALKKI